MISPDAEYAWYGSPAFSGAICVYGSSGIGSSRIDARHADGDVISTTTSSGHGSSTSWVVTSTRSRPELDEPIARAERQLAIAIGSGEVRFPGEHAMLVANAVARRKGKEPALERGLGGGAVAGEPEDRGRRPVPGRDGDQRGDRKRGDDGNAHNVPRSVRT